MNGWSIKLQNIEQYALVLIALWKLGAIALLLNPIYRGRELRELVTDADTEPVGIITTDRDVQQVREDVEGTTVGWVLGTADSDLQSRIDPRVFNPETIPADESSADLLALAHVYTGRNPRRSRCTATTSLSSPTPPAPQAHPRAP